jgi:glycine cleavage system H protein
MKEIGELHLPEELSYSKNHEWVKCLNENSVKIGVSDYAQDQLGDIVYVDLPQVGDSYGRGEEFGNVESVKAVSEVYMPISGEIVAVNTALEDSPELINSAPYNEGWIIEINPGDLSELDELMPQNAYLAMLQAGES